jgi:hypothetical protein
VKTINAPEVTLQTAFHHALLDQLSQPAPANLELPRYGIISHEFFERAFTPTLAATVICGFVPTPLALFGSDAAPLGAGF